MQLPWSFKNIPEIKALPKEEQKAAWQAIFKELSQNPKVRKSRLIGGCILAAFITFNIQINLDTESLLKAVGSSIILGSIGGLFSTVPYLITLKKQRQPYIDEYFQNLSHSS